MSGLSFRPRPIDISKPIPIIRADSEDYEEIIKLAVTVPKIATGMDPEDEEEKHIQEAIKRSLHAQANPSDYAIPTPTFKVVEEPDEPPFERKTSYIHFHVPTRDELDTIVEYDLGDSDCEWLEEYNKEQKGGRRLSEDGLEFMIDRLEKAHCYAKNKSLTQVQAEKVLAEDSTCKVPLVHVGPVYKYWTKKRKGRKQPLIERFHEPPAFDDPSPLVAFRPREPFSKQPKKQLGNRKNDKIAYNKMTQLRREFERSRMLLEMIKKREKLKRDQIQIAFDLFELRAKEGVPLMDDPREATLERELQRERALLASVPSPAKFEKTEQHRKRRRRDSSLLTSSAPSLSLATPGGDALRGIVSRSPGPASKRSKTIVKLTHGQVFPADFRPTKSPIPDFMAIGPPAPLQATQADAAQREREAYEARLQELVRGPPQVPYPMEQAGRIFVGSAIPPFRGRVRIGRGGRVLFDRLPSRTVSSPPSSPAIPSDSEEDATLSIFTSTTTTSSSAPLPPALRPSSSPPTLCGDRQREERGEKRANGANGYPPGDHENEDNELPGLDEVDLEFEVEQAFQALENGSDSLLNPWPGAVTTTTTSNTNSANPFFSMPEAAAHGLSSNGEPAGMATGQEAGDFGSRLARVLRRWRDEEEPQRLAEWQRQRQQPDDVDGDYAYKSDGNHGRRVENVPRVDLVAKFRLAFADRDTAYQPWAMDGCGNDDDDENDDESTDDGMSQSESDTEDALGDVRRKSKPMLMLRRGCDGDMTTETGEAAKGMNECSTRVSKQTKDASPQRKSPRQEEGLNQSGPELAAGAVPRKDGGRDSLSNIWAPSLMT